MLFINKKTGQEDPDRYRITFQGMAASLLDTAVVVGSATALAVVVAVVILLGAAGAVLPPDLGAAVVTDDDLLTSFGACAHVEPPWLGFVVRLPISYGSQEGIYKIKGIF